MTAPPSPESAAPSPDRDARGRFAAGNPGGYGNPFARQVAALRQAMLEGVTGEDLAAVFQAVLAKARAGDLAAARLVLAYAVGKPAPSRKFQPYRVTQVISDLISGRINASTARFCRRCFWLDEIDDTVP